MGLKKKLPSFHSQISITMHRDQKEKKIKKQHPNIVVND